MSKKDLIPITRDYLRKHYEGFPVPGYASSEHEVHDMLSKLTSIMDSAASSGSDVEKSTVSAKRMTEFPKKIDENLWRVRQQCEWIAHLTGSQVATDCYERVVKHQQQTAAAVTAQVESLLPKDWRMSMVKKRQVSKEAKYKKDVEDLMAKPGKTIDDKYNLLWQQQHERRESLAELGNASGMYKFVLKTLGGVPQVLLDFVKQINHPEGPMEEMRIKYGPRVYELLRYANACHVVAALQTDKDTLTSALDLFKKELFAYMDFLYDLFEKSPFFITSADAATASAHEGMSEHSIPARDVFTESVTASAEDVEAGAMLRVQFTLDKKDLKFSVIYRESEDAPESSQKVVLEEKTVASTDGLFDASVKLIAPGIYTARWDNSYSRMTAKTIRFEVDLMHSSSSPGASSS